MAEPHPFVDHFYSAKVRFDAGATAQRVLDEWVLGHTLSGAVTYCTGGGPVTIRAGEFYIIRPKTDMRWTIPAGVRHWHCVYAVFSPRAHWLSWLDFPEEAPGCSRLRPPEKTGRMARRELLAMNLLFWGPGGQRVDYARNRLERALLQLWESCSSGRSSADPRIAEVIDFFHGSLAPLPGLQQLAGRFGMSRSAFYAAFKRQTGSTPSAYHERLRLERATQMLRLSSESVKAIAAKVGFADSKYFSNRFRRMSGLSPQAYRLGHRQGSSRPR